MSYPMCILWAIIALLLLAGMIVLLFRCTIVFIIILIFGLAWKIYDEINSEVTK